MLSFCKKLTHTGIQKADFTVFEGYFQSILDNLPGKTLTLLNTPFGLKTAFLTMLITNCHTEMKTP